MNHPLKFYKLQATGNDFVAVDIREFKEWEKALIDLCPKLCDRKFGIGADGLIMLASSTSTDQDFRMIYRNADGSDAGMCGNGGRAIAKLAHYLGLGSKLQFGVHHSTYSAEVNGDTVKLSWLNLSTKASSCEWQNTQSWEIYTATEHQVIFEEAPFWGNDQRRALGAKMRYDTSVHPKGTNVNFVRFEQNQWHAVTYERGVEDLTLACGTGALATAIAIHSSTMKKAGAHKVEINMPGGALNCSFYFDAPTKTYSNLSLEGAAQIVFKGEFYLD